MGYSYNSKRYNRAYGIAEFIAEGHTIKETAEEFRVSKYTIDRDLVFLAQFGSYNGEEQKRNMELYKKAKAQLASRIGRGKKTKSN